MILDFTAPPAGRARLASCTYCWVRPGQPCNPYGDHFARYLRAANRGAILRAELVAVVEGLDVVGEHVIVPAPILAGVAS